ncbi:hypothetical protein GCM10010965_25110 [Caldalkalibacillus thermarum]|uniref:phage holin family protein n=1 Tax=Caldalkalibacillus thermarum TaxID=296745 RepID=UPI00166EE8FA|nr:phage holin family protein [Caldalkalibacillus thermarum]GGK31300.1 hypothetical protein GCM10010965_25110 [Caldalkalibacillus thermarum]
MDWLSYIVQEAFIVVPVLWLIGLFLKKTPHFADWAIVWVLLLLGITFTVALLGPGVESVIQGILVTGVAVFGHQLVKQTKEGMKN